MKKIFRNVMFFAFGALLSVGVMSCSSDSDSNGSAIDEQNDAIKAITQTYLEKVVYPTYANLANSCDELNTKIGNLNTKLQAGTPVTDAEIKAICDNYKTARNYWEESESFLYGAASDYNIDPHIDTWPLAVETLKDILVNDDVLAKLNESDGVEYARKTLSEDGQLGFHGIEFIFFRDGKARSASYFNNNETESYQDYFTGVDVKAKSEVIYAKAVAGDLRDKVFQLEVCWNPNASASHVERVKACQASMGEDYGIVCRRSGLTYGEDLLATTARGSLASSWKKVMEVILIDGCSNICAEVADQKLGQAYRCAIGQPEEGEEGPDDPNYIESPYSYNSYTDFYGNIMAIQNALYGNIDAATGSYAPNSVMAYLAKYNSQKAASLQAKLSAALAALKACQNSGKAFAQNPGAACAGAAIDAIGELDDELNEASSWILKN